MKFLVFTFLTATVFADRLENTYLPPFGAASAGGSGRFLPTPFHSGQYYPGSSFGVNRNYVQPYNRYPGYSGYNGGILRYNNQNNGDGNYAFDYATQNGITHQETGRLKNIDTSEVHGSYSYTSPEGKQISVNYVADEYGFRASGDHIPTPPPIPDAILKSLQYNAAHPNDDGQYRSNQYDGGYSRHYNAGYRY